MSEDGDIPVTVLASGVALGVYVPAQLVARRLVALQRKARVAVVEALYTDEARCALERHRQAYRADFRLACMVHRVPAEAGAGLCDARVQALLSTWHGEGRTDFIVWSGFWLPVLEAYRREFGMTLNVDFCRIDAQPSTSFRRFAAQRLNAREVWLWNGARDVLEHEVVVGDIPVNPFAARLPRLVVHGGGWGLGTYASAADRIEAQGYGLDVVAYEPPADRVMQSAMPGEIPTRRYFGSSPDWSAIPQRPEDDPGFPPFAEWGTRAAPPDGAALHHEFLAHAAKTLAIVSKPGGGTLMDSLASATPVVLLQPYGDAERANADIWEKLGFGIRMDRWQAQGFAVSVLEQLHDNLAGRARAPVPYPDGYWSPAPQEGSA